MVWTKEMVMSNVRKEMMMNEKNGDEWKELWWMKSTVVNEKNGDEWKEWWWTKGTVMNERNDETERNGDERNNEVMNMKR